MLRPYHILTIAVLLVFTPLTTIHAFVVHGTGAVALDDSIAVYSITYSVKFSDRDAYYPTSAALTADTLQKTVQYDVLNADEAVAPMYSAGRVESAVPIKNEEYFIAEDDVEQQTLYVLVNTTDTMSVFDLAVQLTEIPVRTVQSDTNLSAFRLHGGIFDAAKTNTPIPFTPKN